MVAMIVNKYCHHIFYLSFDWPASQCSLPSTNQTTAFKHMTDLRLIILLRGKLQAYFLFTDLPHSY